MNDGYVDERIKREVLNGLKGIVSMQGYNGDLKERRGPIKSNTTFQIDYLITVFCHLQKSPTIYLSILI